MTESEWQTCTDPQKMLEFLRGKASDRKLRLFTCAYCRHILQGDKAVQVAERIADGLATNAERKHARKEAVKAATRSRLAGRGGINDLKAVAASAIARILCPPGRIYRECGTLPGVVVAAVRVVNPQASDDLQQAQAMFLRDIIGSPFCPVAISPAWLTWNDGTVQKIAQAIYNDRAYDRLPILADALEEAGCTNADILNHCRQPGEHMRGCWVVDLILGKE
ncbi:MAG TPA: hypothetical protein VMF69_18305 [Gemmataceae bacterium]|nr:hypothetical protein [Gemmataceae bacterium]